MKNKTLHLTAEQVLNGIQLADAQWKETYEELTQEKKESMRKFFMTAHMMAKNLLSFSLHKSLCELFEALGADIVDVYKNDKSCKEFTRCIDVVIQTDVKQKVWQSKYVSLLIGGNTMHDEIDEWDTVYIRYLHEGNVRTALLDMIKLCRGLHWREDGKSVMEGLEAALKKLDLTLADLTDPQNDRPTLVSVNFGSVLYHEEIPSIIMGLITMEAPWVLAIHHVPYVLEMSFHDLIFNRDDLKEFGDTVSNLFGFYLIDGRYDEDKREFQQDVENLAETPFFRIRGYDTICLPSQFKVLLILLKNMKEIYVDLKHRAAHQSDMSDGDDESSDDDFSDEARARKYLGEITVKKFMMLLHLTSDITKLLEKFGEKHKSLDIFDGYGAVNFLTMQLEFLKENKGRYCKEFQSKFDGEKYKGIKLSGDNPGEGLAADVIDHLIAYINRRFEIFSQSPLKAFQAFNYTEFPEDGFQLEQHGCEDLQLLMDYYVPLLHHTDRNQILHQYGTLKTKLIEYKSSEIPRKDVFASVIKDAAEANLEIAKLIEIMQVVSPSVEEWEKGLEKMEELKRELRVRRAKHADDARWEGREYDSDDDDISKEEVRMKINISCTGELSEEAMNRAIGYWAACDHGQAVRESSEDEDSN